MNAASSAPTKKEKTDLDLRAPECEMDRILSNREHFASHRIQNGTEMIKHCLVEGNVTQWSRLS